MLDRLWKADNDAVQFYLTALDPKFEHSVASPLHVVASKGLAAYTKHLVDLGEDFNKLDNFSRTPLHYAARNGHTNAVNMLLECEALHNPDDRSGLTPIHLAAQADQFEVVKVLLLSGVPLLTPKTKENPGNWCGNAPRTLGTTAFEYASRYGHTKTVVQFLPYLDIEGLSKALCWAAEAGKTEAILAILEDPRVDVNKMIDNKTPLHIASHSQDLESMRKLIKLGADASIKCNSIFGRHGIRCIGLEDNLEYSPLHAYTPTDKYRNCSPSLMGFKLLLDAGCDINEYDGAGYTVIHLALQGKMEIEIIRFLLDSGADPSMTTKDGLTAFHCGIHMSREVIELLLKHGADINARRATDGQTPIHGSQDPLPLIKSSADCNAQDFQGNTPLHIMMGDQLMSATTAKVLIKNGADPNIKNRKGHIALHESSRRFCPLELIPYFVNAKVDLESKTFEGYTVLLKAIKNGAKVQDVECLLDAGADVLARDFEGRTVLHYCCESLSSDCMNILSTFISRGANPKG